jgi:hypothetical protein
MGLAEAAYTWPNERVILRVAQRSCYFALGVQALLLLITVIHVVRSKWTREGEALEAVE